ncbi:MAG: preprotein translocase subunit SecE [Erysipelothrix sp.]|nr:preprotein translocase subunit SecE [Erysipelothrix sp.]
MSWFSIQGIKDEIRKIVWPTRKQMVKDIFTVLLFIGFFIIYFLFSEVIISQILRMLKVF